MTKRSSSYAAGALLVPAMLVHLAACHHTNITANDGGGFGSGVFSDGGSFDTGIGVGAQGCFPPGGVGGGAACTLDCPFASSACLAAPSASGGLRVAQLTPSLPASLAAGMGRGLLADAVMPKLPSCGLHGQESFTWLLEFDSSTLSLKTGGGKLDLSTDHYSFIDQMIPSGSATFHVAPVTLQAPVTTMCSFGSSVGQEITLPLYLSDTEALLFPLHHLQFRTSSISMDLTCIGQFNANLDASNGCAAPDPHALFNESGGFDAWFDLEEADTVESETLGMSLCALLSGDPDTFGDGAKPVSHCKRDDTGAIVFQGDWCGAENHAATDGCAEALRFSATFAASGVQLY